MDNLKKITEENANEVKLLLKSFLDVDKIERMDIETGRLLAQLLVGTETINKTLGSYSSTDNPELPFLTRILIKRLVITGNEEKIADMSTILFISSLCKTPGDAVLWAWTLWQLYLKLNTTVTLKIVYEEFPMGFPTEEAGHEIWDNQKGYTHGIEVDNILDNGLIWRK